MYHKQINAGFHLEFCLKKGGTNAVCNEKTKKIYDKKIWTHNVPKTVHKKELYELNVPFLIFLLKWGAV